MTATSSTTRRSSVPLHYDNLKAFSMAFKMRSKDILLRCYTCPRTLELAIRQGLDCQAAGKICMHKSDIRLWLTRTEAAEWQSPIVASHVTPPFSPLASHGIKRVKETPEALALRKEKERGELEKYTKLSDEVLAHKISNGFTPESFEMTTRLLAKNPEFYTVWNFRRNILLKGIFPTKSAKEVNDILQGDLLLTKTALRSYPKVYWIWNHRRWCLQNIPDNPDGEPSSWQRATWAGELQTVEKILDFDPRNFHAWNYRRYILASSDIQTSPTQELAYTARKIESNFSNFSAWHQRSKVFSTIWEGVSDEERRRMRDEEFDFVKQGIYTDPGDQSVWLYHRWLIGQSDNQAILAREIKVIEELRELEPESKWCLETLVHYKALLFRHQPSAELTTECIGILLQLQQIDPFRKARYMELARRFKP